VQAQEITDRPGKIILKPAFKQAVKADNVCHVLTTNEVKASAVGHLMLKTKVQRYFTTCNTSSYVDVLSKFIKSCSHSFHQAIRARPVDTNTSKSLQGFGKL